MQIFIYRITNLLNNKLYFGQTSNPGIRWSGHKSEAKKRENHPLYNSMNKYGIDNFKYEIIHSCQSQEEADNLEKELIEKHQTQNREFGYNIAQGGNRTKHSEETKQKLSQQKTEFYQKRLQEIGVKMTEEERQKLSTSHLGKSSPRKGTTCSEESRLKMSRAQTGKKASEETKRKKSEAMKAICENNPDFVETIRARSTGRFKLNKDQEAEICALYQGGLTSRQIGEKFVVSPTTICSILRRNNKLHE